jgi:hypothetical protein
VKEDTVKKEFYVHDLKFETVETFEEMINLLNRGEYNRHYTHTFYKH